MILNKKNEYKYKLCVIVAVLGVVFLCTILLFILETSFNSEYWEGFITSILTNVIVVSFVLFIIDRILNEERNSKLEKINFEKSKHIAFCIKQMQFDILVFVGVIEKKLYLEKLTESRSEDIFDGIPILYQNHLEKFNSLILKKIEEANDKGLVIGNFSKIIEERGVNIEKQLEEIFPKPRTDVLNYFKVDLIELLGAISLVKDFFNFIEEELEVKIKEENPKGVLDKGTKDAYVKFVFTILATKLSHALSKLIESLKYAEELKLFEEI